MKTLATTYVSRQRTRLPLRADRPANTWDALDQAAERHPAVIACCGNDRSTNW